MGGRVRGRYQGPAGCLSSEQGTGYLLARPRQHSPGSTAGEQCFPGAGAPPPGSRFWSPHCGPCWSRCLPSLQLAWCPEGFLVSWGELGPVPTPLARAPSRRVTGRCSCLLCLPAFSQPLPPEVDPRPRGGSSDALIGPGPQSGGEISCDPQPSLASGACARGSHRALPVDPPWGGRWPGCGLCARACSPGCVRAGVLSQVRAVCAALRGRSPRKLGEGLPDTLPCPKVSDRHSAPKPTAANNKQH